MQEADSRVGRLGSLVGARLRNLVEHVRREFQADWLRFIADPAEADTPILV